MNLLLNSFSEEELLFNNLLVHLKHNAHKSILITIVCLNGQDVKNDFEHFYRALKYIMAYEDVELNI